MCSSKRFATVSAFIPRPLALRRRQRGWGRPSATSGRYAQGHAVTSGARERRDLTSRSMFRNWPSSIRDDRAPRCCPAGPAGERGLRFLLYAVDEAHAGTHERQQFGAIHFSPAFPVQPCVQWRARRDGIKGTDGNAVESVTCRLPRSVKSSRPVNQPWSARRCRPSLVSHPAAPSSTMTGISRPRAHRLAAARSPWTRDHRNHPNHVCHRIRRSHGLSHLFDQDVLSGLL
jgi:hypothetical protein